MFRDSSVFKDRALYISVIISSSLSCLAFALGYQFTGFFSAKTDFVDFTIKQIFFHNMIVACILMCGVFSYGLISMVVLTTNFIVFGMQTATMMEQLNWLAVINKIVWHGLFELPAIFLAGGFGFYLLVSHLLLQKKIEWRCFYLRWVYLALCVSFLNIIAAVIEVYVNNHGR